MVPTLVLRKTLPSFQQLSRSSEHDETQLSKLYEALDDAIRISRFANDFRSPMVFGTDLSELVSQMTTNSLYAVELAEKDRSTIVAVAARKQLTMPLHQWTNREDAQPASEVADSANISSATLPDIVVKVFHEAAGMRCVFNGYHLHRKLVSIRLIEQLIFNPIGPFFTAVFSKNGHVVNDFISNMKFRIWEDHPLEIRAMKDYTLKNLSRGSEDYILLRPTFDTIRWAAYEILHTARQDIVTRTTNLSERGQGKPDSAAYSGHAYNQAKIRFAINYPLLDDIVEWCVLLSRRTPTSVRALEEILENRIPDDFLDQTE